MLHRAVQVRLYPTKEQETQLAQSFGCARWWWNYALNKSIETYKETGKGLTRAALNALLPILKKAEDTIWLADCYSQVLQATTLNLTKDKTVTQIVEDWVDRLPNIESVKNNADPLPINPAD